MPDTLHDPHPFALQSNNRPLLGVTILLVEDSRFASDAIRLMCLHSGARIRRADCLASARKHLRAYAPWVVIVDLGLPDGRGEDLIAELARACPRPPHIIATSGDEFGEACAIAAGADAFLAKPVASLAQFQHMLLTLLGEPARHIGAADVASAVTPDPIALRDDLIHVAALLRDAPDADALRYAAQFTSALATSAQDEALRQAAHRLGDTPAAQAAAPLAQLRALIDERVGAAALV